MVAIYTISKGPLYTMAEAKAQGLLKYVIASHILPITMISNSKVISTNIVPTSFLLV